MSHLFNSQKHALCFHELNPTGAVFSGNPQAILNTINEFQRILDGGAKHLLSLDYSREASVKRYEDLKQMSQVDLIGDIAYYYLKYVDDILAINSNVRFVCIKRDKTQTVDSWISKSAIHRWRSLWLADRLKSLITRAPFHRSKNFWQMHDGSEYQLDPVWDKTFPKFEADTKRGAIEQYWEYYYAEAEVLEKKHPSYFRIFDISKLSSMDGQREILGFVGLPENDMTLQAEFHMHKRMGD